MWRHSLCSAVLICLSCSFLMVTSAPAQATAGNPDGKASTSPQLLYMKRLHDRIKGMKVKVDQAELEIKDEQTSGTLIATSIEAGNDISGAGWSSNGFFLEDGNLLILNFDIPNPGDAIGIHETDLWIFPDSSQLENNSIMDLTLLVVVELAHAKNPRRELMNYSWRMDSSCLRLNMTGLSRKIINNLQKRGLEKTNVTVKVEVVTARDPEVIQSTQFDLDEDLREGCSALLNRSSNTAFLVMKYYNEQHLINRPLTDDSTSDEGSSSQNSRQHKRQSESDVSDTNEVLDDLPTLASTSDPWKGCSVVPLKVNLTKVFGDFILLPKEMYIQDCFGSCNTGRNAGRFTLHARTKERVKLVEGVDNIQRSETCCTPSRYDHEDLLIRKENYIAIVSFPDMVVTGCHCA